MKQDLAMHKLLGKHEWGLRVVKEGALVQKCKVCGKINRNGSLYVGLDASTFANISTTNTTNSASGATLTLEKMEEAVKQLKDYAEYEI